MAAMPSTTMGFLAFISKSKCVGRNVDDEGSQYGAAFADKAIMPDAGRYETVNLTHDMLTFKR